MIKVGSTYFNGNGVVKDNADAMKWFSKAVGADTTAIGTIG